MATITLHFSNRTPGIITAAEQNSGVSLTDEARDLINLPIDELITSQVPFNWQDVESSVYSLVKSTSKDYSPGARNATGQVTSLGVIRSYWQNFCNIPPFCASTKTPAKRP